MTGEQFEILLERLTWVGAAMINNTVKQVELECVRRLQRALSAEEKDQIHQDCLNEVHEIMTLITPPTDG